MCPECGNEFYAKPSRPDIKFCSIKCRSKNHHCFTTCKNCSKEFEVVKSRQNKAAFCSAKCREDFLNKFHRITRACLNCGKEFTRKKYRQKQIKLLFCSVPCANLYLFKGKSFSKKHRQRISKALTGKPKSREHIDKYLKGDNNPSKRPEVREKISDSVKKYFENHEGTFKGKRHSPEARAKQRQARLKRVFPHRDTQIEVLLQNELKQRGFIFRTHLPIEDICQPDIVFPDEKVVVEADGNYWHSLPKAIIKDRKNGRVLRERGWKVLRLSETQIKNNVKDCVDRIELLLLQ